jgi:hypothetical protein
VAKIVNEIRRFVAVICLAIAGVVFLLPAVAALLVFGAVGVICFLTVAIGGVLGAVFFIPVILITPGGVDEVVKSIAAE